MSGTIKGGLKFNCISPYGLMINKGFSLLIEMSTYIGTIILLVNKPTIRQNYKNRKKLVWCRA